MSKRLISRSDAESDLLACAAYIAESITGGEAQAEAMSPVVSAYLHRGNVDLAAELANSIDDPFTRDRTLIAVASKCAELDDDEYAMQLCEAIEDPAMQAQALERIGMIKAEAGEIEAAREIAVRMPHPDRVLAAVAMRQADDSDMTGAFATVEEMEYPGAITAALNRVALRSIGNASFGTVIDRSIREAKGIELVEERIHALTEIGDLLREAGENDRCTKTLEMARGEAEALDTVHRDRLLADISIAFLEAGDIERADATLDLVGEKTQLATVVLGFSRFHWRRGEANEALEVLEEAYEIVRSQHESETRDSKARFNLIGTIAAQFAGFAKIDRALDVVDSIKSEDHRNSALVQIAQIAGVQGSDSYSREALSMMSNGTSRAAALVAMNDSAAGTDRDAAVVCLNEAEAIVSELDRPAVRADLLLEIGERFWQLGEADRTRSILSNSLVEIGKIQNAENRVKSLTRLARFAADIENRWDANDIEKFRSFIAEENYL